MIRQDNIMKKSFIMSNLSKELAKQLKDWDDGVFDTHFFFESSFEDLETAMLEAKTEDDLKALQDGSDNILKQIKKAKKILQCRLAMLDAISTDDLNSAINKEFENRRMALANFKPEYEITIRQRYEFDKNSYREVSYIAIILETYEGGNYKHFIRSEILTKLPVRAKRQVYNFVENYLSTHKEDNITTLSVDNRYVMPEYKDMFSNIYPFVEESRYY